MRIKIIVLLAFFVNFVSKSQVTDGTSPSGTLPVLYINTVDGEPINQREYYIEATAWLDASMNERYESVGSESNPLKLGIRGRGNSSWWSVAKKPYKLRFEKPVSLLGFVADQHFALLHWIGSTTAYFREPIGYEATRRLSSEWVPSIDALEVVLNGDYVGLYFLSETVRVSDNRVDIPKQPDGAVDDEVIDSGWLVEIDNYDDVNQTRLYEPDGRTLKLTFKSPEILSGEQRAYIESEFNNIISLVHGEDISAGNWLDVIDGESMARYYIVTELLQNKDGCNGSFYWHKSSDSKWIAGPMWDLSYSLERCADDTYLHTLPASSDPKLIRKMLENADFRDIIKEVWAPFYEGGLDWVDRIVDEWIEKIEIAAVSDYNRWTFGHRDVEYAGKIAASIMKSNIEWFNTYLDSEQFNEWVASGIIEVENESESGEAYDLLGRRVASPSRGVFICRGQKIVKQVQ